MQTSNGGQPLDHLVRKINGINCFALSACKKYFACSRASASVKQREENCDQLFPTIFMSGTARKKETDVIRG